ncbi:hypothetical protein [Longitalea luteola]|uniref:hypothetical protein n=1 Tax=Longitalea luteola TaxID=2812563 RepID=UPI001A958A6E|nr:hypothetical protein [Longitalea luteola]
MFKTTTTFSKAQNPDVSIPLLIDIYTQELEYQEISNISREYNTLYFLNNPYNFFQNKLTNKFSNFLTGKITIEETEKEYLVSFQADISRLLIKTGIFAALICLTFSVLGTFNWAIFLFALFIFAVFSGTAYALTAFTFPKYFTRLRNEIERLLKEEMKKRA